MIRVYAAVSLLFVFSAGACGGAQREPKSASPPAESPQAASPARAAAPSADSAAAAESAAKTPSPEAFAPPGDGVRSRAAAMLQAAREIDTSHRELELAGHDCQNACRALGSMDRAAGRLCNLAQSNDEVGRCESARNTVYSARDKVRSSCGSCPDVSVDRSAPIPSR